MTYSNRESIISDEIIKKENHKGKREIKSTLFTKLFEDDRSKIELYNALTDSDFGPETEVLEVTLDDALYHNKRNYIKQS